MKPDPRPWLAGNLQQRLEPMLEMLAAAPASLSSITNPDEARRVHLADSLSGLAIDEVNAARRVTDVGSGAGFPGIPLAMARPEAEFTLLDSVGKKVDFMSEVIERLGLGNATAINRRSEEWAAADGAGASDLVTARAVAPLEALAELASPLLESGGSLVAWKGEREPESEEKLKALGAKLAMKLDRIVPVKPYSGSRERHIYVVRKTAATPSNLPRRAGMVRKRPLTAPPRSAEN